VAPATIWRVTSTWTEVGDGVLLRRYAFFDQNIVAIVGRGETLVVDTRTTYPQAREILEDLASLHAPRVTVVVNTHGHYDHAFGNAVFRPAVIWGHERCVPMLEQGGDRQRALAVAGAPGLAADLAEVEIVPPERTFAFGATVEVGGRRVELAHLGRGHTDNDIVVTVPDADVLCAGDLLENDAIPWFGDGYPMDWPETARRLLALTDERTVVVPGHGRHSGRELAASQMVAFREIAALAERVHTGALDLDAALAAAPWPGEPSREPLERALSQLRGELDS
jgi:glyoxylase-like metal-dependent hydrolase (beta-lactamase superfamily II)